jgi:hypothetical protein
MASFIWRCNGATWDGDHDDSMRASEAMEGAIQLLQQAGCHDVKPNMIRFVGRKQLESVDASVSLLRCWHDKQTDAYFVNDSLLFMEEDSTSGGDYAVESQDEKDNACPTVGDSGAPPERSDNTVENSGDNVSDVNATNVISKEVNATGGADDTLADGSLVGIIDKNGGDYATNTISNEDNAAGKADDTPVETMDGKSDNMRANPDDAPEDQLKDTPMESEPTGPNVAVVSDDTSSGAKCEQRGEAVGKPQCNEDVTPEEKKEDKLPEDEIRCDYQEDEEEKGEQKDEAGDKPQCNEDTALQDKKEDIPLGDRISCDHRESKGDASTSSDLTPNVTNSRRGPENDTKNTKPRHRPAKEAAFLLGLSIAREHPNSMLFEKYVTLHSS